MSGPSLSGVFSGPKSLDSSRVRIYFEIHKPKRQVLVGQEGIANPG